MEQQETFLVRFMLLSDVVVSGGERINISLCDRIK